MAHTSKDQRVTNRNIYSCLKFIFFHTFITVRDFCARRLGPVADDIMTATRIEKHKTNKNYFSFGAMKIDMCQMIPSGAPRH